VIRLFQPLTGRGRSEWGCAAGPLSDPCLLPQRAESGCRCFCWNGQRAEVQVQTSQGTKRKEQTKIESHKQAVEPLLDTLWSGKMRVVSALSEIDVVGHRVVNGVQDYQQPIVITPEVRAAIARMSAFAPLHNRAELEGMDIIEKRFGPVLQVAVFDTGFHSREPAFVYPGPYEWLTQGIRRYGFHRINHQYCAERTAQLLGRPGLTPNGGHALGLWRRGSLGSLIVSR
jgi:acetate kinase